MCYVHCHSVCMSLNPVFSAVCSICRGHGRGQSPWNRRFKQCEPPRGCREPSLSPLQEQKELLTDEPLLYPSLNNGYFLSKSIFYKPTWQQYSKHFNILKYPAYLWKDLRKNMYTPKNLLHPADFPTCSRISPSILNLLRKDFLQGLPIAVKMRKIHKFLWLFLPFSLRSEVFSVIHMNSESGFTRTPSNQSEYIRKEVPPITHLEGSQRSALCVLQSPWSLTSPLELTSCCVLSFISCSFKLIPFCNS